MSLRKCTFSMPLLVVALLALFSCVSNFVSREEYKVTVVEIKSAVGHMKKWYTEALWV